MIQLFDTHRLPYRNAKLRAWDLATKTQRINFQNYGSQDTQWTDIGSEVMTDESGYLFYGNGAHKVECLGVAAAAIVEVSVDGGHSYLIQFVIHPDHDPTALHTDDISSLTFRNNSGTYTTYNPLTGNKQLPDYLRRDEYQNARWAEGRLVLQDDPVETVSIWTHIILISTSPSVSTFHLTLPETGPFGPRLRNGQCIFIHAQSDVTILIADQSLTIQQNKNYMLHNNVGNTRAQLTEL
jgi:hypothetical protein